MCTSVVCYWGLEPAELCQGCCSSDTECYDIRLLTQFYLLLSVLLLLSHMTETLSYCLLLSAYFLLSLLRTHCSLLLDSPLLLQAIVLVTHCSHYLIVLVMTIVLITLLFS